MNFYWICSACAKELGGVWPQNHVATVAYMKCECCDGKKQRSDEAIAPWVDYDWPDKKKTKAARANRD